AVTGMALFALMANFFDGIAVASDVAGRATYLRRYTPAQKVASVMGFQNTLIYFGTIVGACISLVLIPFVSYPWIFFGIIPTNAITLLLFVYFLPKDKRVSGNTKSDGYWSVWKHVAAWSRQLLLLAALTLFFYALTALATILIPI